MSDPDVIDHAETWRTLWVTGFGVDAAYGQLPRPLLVGHGETRDPRYRSAGAWRRDEVGILHLTLAGEGRFRDNAGEHRVRPGEGFLCRVTDPVTAYWYPADARATWRWLWIAMGGDVLLATLAELVARHGAVLRFGLDHPLVARLDSWRRRRVRHQELDAEAAWRLCSEVLAACLACAAAPRDLVARARRRLGQTLADPPSIAQLAAELGCTREHLSRAFARRYGESPAAFLQRERLRLGRELLTGTSLPVAEIARRCGYAHPGNFTRALRREGGGGSRALRRAR